MDQVVRARGADLRQLPRAPTGDERERVRRPIDRQDPVAYVPPPIVQPGVGALGGRGEVTAQDRQDRREQVQAVVAAEWRSLLPAKRGRRGRALVDEGGCPVDGRAGGVVDRPVGVSPGDESVPGEDDQFGGRIGPDGLADLFRQGEPGPDVRNPEGGVTEAFPDEALAIGGAGQHVDRVRVRMIDAGGGDEGVQQRLDAAARHGWVDLATGKVGDHRGVVHRVPA